MAEEAKRSAVATRRSGHCNGDRNVRAGRLVAIATWKSGRLLRTPDRRHQASDIDRERKAGCALWGSVVTGPENYGRDRLRAVGCLCHVVASARVGSKVTIGDDKAEAALGMIADRKLQVAETVSKAEPSRNRPGDGSHWRSEGRRRRRQPAHRPHAGEPRQASTKGDAVR